MQMNEMGRTGIMVSELCLGTMTFGTQTNADDAHLQIDTALAAGINFIDTAEMYPVNPIAKETVGGSEKIIGDWLAKNPARRDEFILATNMPVRVSRMRATVRPFPRQRSRKRLRRACVALKQITSIFINFIGQTVDPICSARIGPMIQVAKTGRKPLIICSNVLRSYKAM